METGALTIAYNGVPLRGALIRSVGFAFDRTWMNAIYLTPLLEGLIRGFSYESMATVYIAELAACSILFLLAVTLSTHLKPLRQFSESHPRAYQLFGGCCASVGILLIAASSLCTQGSTEELVIQIVAGSLTGIGEAVLILQWGAIFVVANSKTTNVEICVSFVLGALIPALLSLCPTLVRIAVVTVCPVISNLMMGFASFEQTIAFISGDEMNAPTNRLSDSQKGTQSRTKEVFGLKILLASFVLSLTLSVLRIYDNGSLFREHYDLSPFVAGMLGIVVYSLIAAKFSHEYRFAYRIVISLVFAGVVLMLFINDYFICDMIARIGLFCFELLFFIMTVNITANLKLRTIKLIALPEFGYMLSELIGSIFIWLKPSISFAEHNSWFIGMMLASLFLVYCYILTENDIINVESWGLYPDQATDDIVPSENAESSEDVQNGAKYKSTIKNFATEWAQYLANEYGLSEREKEIAVCLALGYSRGQIKEALFISLGTVNTHISHIYQKLEVHSRGELQDLLYKWNQPE